MTETERAALLIEDKLWGRGAIGDKDQACYDAGLSPITQARMVLGLIERPDVIAEYPVLTARLRRLVELRRSSRARRGSRTGRQSTWLSQAPTAR